MKFDYDKCTRCTFNEANPDEKIQHECDELIGKGPFTARDVAELARRVRYYKSAAELRSRCPFCAGRNVAVVGTRYPSDYLKIAVEIAMAFLPGDSTIITGGAIGIDALAEQVAEQRGMKLIKLVPDYAQHFRAAPLIRNGNIAMKCDRMIAAPGPESRGTWDAIKKANKYGKPVLIVSPIKEKGREEAV